MSEGGVELTREELEIVVQWGNAVQREWGVFDPEDNINDQDPEFWLWHRLAKQLGWSKQRRLYEAYHTAERKRLGQILRARGL
jgi:hypothetical protein